MNSGDARLKVAVSLPIRWMLRMDAFRWPTMSAATTEMKLASIRNPPNAPWLLFMSTTARTMPRRLERPQAQPIQSCLRRFAWRSSQSGMSSRTSVLADHEADQDEDQRAEQDQDVDPRRVPIEGPSLDLGGGTVAADASIRQRVVEGDEISRLPLAKAGETPPVPRGRSNT